MQKKLLTILAATLFTASLGLAGNSVQAAETRENLAQEKMKTIHKVIQSPIEKTDPDYYKTINNLVYGEVYQYGSKLSDGQKSLFHIVAVVATNNSNSVAPLIQASLNAGATPLEIKETLYQMGPYVGIPTVITALEEANKVFRKNGIKLPLPSQTTVTEATRAKDGLQVQGDIFDHTRIAAMRANAPENQQHIMREYLSDYCFGDTYTRGTLDLQMRELITLTAIASMGGADPQFRTHVQANLNVGVDKNTMLEALTQCIPYIGFPKTLNALGSLNHMIPENTPLSR